LAESGLETLCLITYLSDRLGNAKCNSQMKYSTIFSHESIMVDHTATWAF